MNESRPADVVGGAGEDGPRRSRLGHREHPACTSEPDCQATSAWPPLALLLTAELVTHIPVRERRSHYRR